MAFSSIKNGIYQGPFAAQIDWFHRKYRPRTHPRWIQNRTRNMETRLLLQRRWSVQRYLHLREGFLYASGVSSVLAVGVGRGLAEIALAIEFPHVQFHLTDIQSPNTPNYSSAQELCKIWRLKNVSFGVVDIMDEPRRQYDLVSSVEVLEHIENHESAAENMKATARKFVFCLVPYADDATNSNDRRREIAWKKNEHYRVGYSDKDLATLFPNGTEMRGCYWQDHGQKFRQNLDEISDQDLQRRSIEFLKTAREDIVDRIPHSYPEALGIWILSRTDA